MKIYTLIFIAFFIASCSSTQTAEYEWEGLTVSGEFLFEGPNTLQGQPDPVLENIADELGVAKENIKAVYVKSATITYAPDTLQSNIESALVQWVSNDLELVSIATRSPLMPGTDIALEVTSEQDILPYLKDETSSLVVDSNIKNDMDELNADVDLVLNVEYTN